MKSLQSLRGFVDLLPQQLALWQHVETVAREHFRCAAVSEIRTPFLEHTELFSRGIGDATDVVGKEMYTFADRGNRSCTLRPEGTASVVRAAIQHGLLSQGVQRLWYSGSMFRYERPQAGRQRQFNQIGVEWLGVSDAQSDAEIIALAWDLLTSLGLDDLTLELNSLGHSEDRLAYRDVLVEWLEQHRDELDPDSQARISSNPLRVLDSKHPATQSLLVAAPQLNDVLSSESQERFLQVQEALSALGIPFVLNPRLVRGLDYYSHTAFECTSLHLGAQATVCGGGRYDGLVQQLGGPQTAAMGWALGMERLVLLLEQRLASGALTLPRQRPDLYIATRGDAAAIAGLQLAVALRRAGLAIERDASDSSFGKQMKRAQRSEARCVVMFSQEELQAGSVTLKPLQAATQPVDVEASIALTDTKAMVRFLVALSLDAP
ncbi:MAG: histidine--tRNA ligase [Cyanobacteria bacterium K_DeepCast_35m_m2_023]|nr:histidine--tRNA ligase [Cyanobacteria bacterium K_DeepCast_35m_m2_023]